MNNELLNIIVKIRGSLTQVISDNGQITGLLEVSQSNVEDLRFLVDNMIIENTQVSNGQSILLDKVHIEGKSIPITLTLYTKNLNDGYYFENLNDFILENPSSYPSSKYYVHDLHLNSDQIPLHEEMIKLIGVYNFIELLNSIADIVQEHTGEPDTFIFFDKKKLAVPIQFTRNHIVQIPFLDELKNHLTVSHDKEERITIFKNEMISTLYDSTKEDRFGKFLFRLAEIYSNYLKSHLLYLEKFSYHDLKSEIDNDKLDYTKKIYGTVNDVQTKLIAVPAAFLLVLSQFDFSGSNFYKNVFISIGSCLFAFLLEILLSNQFGLLRYIVKEIDHFKNELKNKETQVDLSEFIISFADLNPIITMQRIYLWIFRVIVWAVPVLCIIMTLVFKK